MRLERWLLLWLVLFSGAALFWPWPDFDLFVRTAELGQPMFAVTMACIGFMLPPKEVDDTLRNLGSVGAGVATQYLTMPLMAFGLASIPGLSPETRLGLILVGCVPGAMASNVLTLQAGGNASYSVGLTTLATLLSPIAVPFALGLALGNRDPETVKLLLTSSLWLFVTVVLPVIVGQLASRILPLNKVQRQQATSIGRFIANFTILWIIAVVIAKNRNELSTDSFPRDLVHRLFWLNMGGYFVGFVAGSAIRLDIRKRRALTLEIGMQNAGLGALLAAKLFGDLAALPPALFTFGCMLSGTVLANNWSWLDRRKAAANREVKHGESTK